MKVIHLKHIEIELEYDEITQVAKQLTDAAFGQIKLLAQHLEERIEQAPTSIRGKLLVRIKATDHLRELLNQPGLLQLQTVTTSQQINELVTDFHNNGEANS